MDYLLPERDTLLWGGLHFTVLGEYCSNMSYKVTFDIEKPSTTITILFINY